VPLPSWRRPRESYVRRRSLFLATARRLPELGMLAPLPKRRPPIKRLVASSPARVLPDRHLFGRSDFARTLWPQVVSA
jgi:hypothetical protein